MNAKTIMAIAIICLMTATTFAEIASGHSPQSSIQPNINNDIEDTPIYQDPNKPLDERVQDLLSRMTLQEKIEQMSGNLGIPASYFGIPLEGELGGDLYSTSDNTRLGIPGFVFVDTPHGCGQSSLYGTSTSFPVASAQSSTWDRDLIRDMGVAIAEEARAKGCNVALGPMINMVIDPRGGRSQELLGGEDPYLSGSMAVPYIEGVQSEGIMANAKVFACNNLEDDRFTIDVQVDERTLREIFLPHQKVCSDAGVASFMSAYNKVNGEYCGENNHLLREILKGEWGFKGFVVSDWIFGCHSTEPSVTAGLDVEMPFPIYYGQPLLLDVELGQISENVVNDAVTRILREKIRFGLLDPEYNKGDPALIGCANHTEIALQIEREGAVLLKNDGPLLPIKRSDIISIAVIGPAADDPDRLGDHGSSNVAPTYVVTALQGIRNKAGEGIEVLYSDGSDVTAAEEMAASSDVVIVVTGLSAQEEGENIVPTTGGDRDDIKLPDDQIELINSVASKNPNTVVVLIAGSAISVEDWIEKIPSIIMAWYPGQEGGNALAEIIFGDINPSGKLCMTFPKSIDQLPPFDDQYEYYHGYRRFDKYDLEPRFPFGYGLSYTAFEYSNLRLDKNKITMDGKVTIKADVTNIGDMAGDDVVQLYVGYDGSRVDRVVKELKGFERISLQPGEKKTVTFTLEPKDLAFYNVVNSEWEIETISHPVYIGSSSRDIRLNGEFAVADASEQSESNGLFTPGFDAICLLAATIGVIFIAKKMRN